MANLAETLDGVIYDELIGGTAVTPILHNVMLTAADTNRIPRGTLLSEADGKFTVCAFGGAAAAVLARDAQAEAAGDIEATVYVRGEFNREKILCAEGDTADAHESELRKIGIYLTSIHGAAVPPADSEDDGEGGGEG